MGNGGLKSFLRTLENAGELIRVAQFVSPNLEITEITDRISKKPDGGEAILFENTGTCFPVLINALGSEKRIALAFGRNSIFDLEKEIERLFFDLMQPKENLWDKLKLLPKLKEVSEWMPKKTKRKGKCQEMVMNEPDLSLLPILTCWPADGGPFVTLPGVHTIDPQTGTPNVGMYRMQVLDRCTTGMHWHKHKTGANHFEKYKKLGKKMPVSVSLGGDLAYTYAATAPMPENMDEYLLAGFLRKKNVKLVKCLTNDLYVPEDSDFVIEGYVDPSEELVWEGPFGDHTGFYSLADWYPKFHVTCITHQKEAVYPATIVGVPPMEDAYIGLATERIFLSPIRFAMVPELKDMILPVAGVAHNFTVVKIEKNYPGQAIKVMNSLWGAGQMMFNKILIVVDGDVDINDSEQLMKAFTQNFEPGYSLHFSKGPMDVLDHASHKFAFGSKLGMDLTKPFSEESAEQKENESAVEELDAKGLKTINYVSGFNDLLQKQSLPVLLLSVRKIAGFSKNELLSQLLKLKGIASFKGIMLFDDGADLTDQQTLLWLLGGNIEPERDISVHPILQNEKIVLVDATFKTQAHDGFERLWPNVLTMDDETISSIDNKWKGLGLGEFVESPSIKLKPLVKGLGAVREI